MTEPGTTTKSPPPGPVFISGRQHSGNTVLTLITGRIDGCLALEQEGLFFEHRGRLDAMKDARSRADWIAGHLYLGNDDLSSRVKEHLGDWASRHPEADALVLYRRAMCFVTETTENRFWIQKATSYIFYANELLTSMPEARFIYLIRNPYDVCASKKNRRPTYEHVVGWVISWNKGIRLARRIARRFPDRVHLVRYEELVAHSERTVRSVCRFIGAPYQPSLLEVPHVNPSEDPYQVQADTRGLTDVRVNRYLDQLSPSECAALDALLDSTALEQFYPDLPHRGRTYSWAARLGAAGLILTGPLRYGFDQIRFARRYGLPLIRRTLRQIRPT